MISKIIKFPILKRLIPSLSIRVLKLLNINRRPFTIDNFKMYLDFLDPIDREIILHKEYEKIEISFLIDQIKKYNICYFLDIGSNCGYYSLKISKEISNISILAFEPNVEAHKKFSKSLKLNPDLSKKIKLENFGLSNKSTRLMMRSKVRFGYNQTGGSSIITKNDNDKDFTFYADFIICDKYIKMIDKKISIKIDVEGHELSVLEGMSLVLKRNKCILQIEIFNQNFDLVNKFLSSLGYKKFYEVNNKSNYFYNNF